jgi:hypothetical protein
VTCIGSSDWNVPTHWEVTRLDEKRIFWSEPQNIPDIVVTLYVKLDVEKKINFQFTL